MLLGLLWNYVTMCCSHRKKFYEDFSNPTKNHSTLNPIRQEVLNLPAYWLATFPNDCERLAFVFQLVPTVLGTVYIPAINPRTNIYPLKHMLSSFLSLHSITLFVGLTWPHMEVWKKFDHSVRRDCGRVCSEGHGHVSGLPFSRAKCARLMKAATAGFAPVVSFLKMYYIVLYIATWKFYCCIADWLGKNRL